MVVRRTWADVWRAVYVTKVREVLVRENFRAEYIYPWSLQRVISLGPPPQIWIRPKTWFKPRTHAIRNPKTPSGQYILVEAVRAIDELRRLRWDIQFRWIPAHIGVPGNEAADRAAKEAASHDPNSGAQAEPRPEPDSLQTLMATTKRIIRKTMRDEWDASWETAKHGRELSKLGVRPGKDVLITHAGTQSCQLCYHTSAQRQNRPARVPGIHQQSRHRQMPMRLRYADGTTHPARIQRLDRHKMWAGKHPCVDIKRILCSSSMAVQAAKS